jgi:hypothetical protein
VGGQGAGEEPIRRESGPPGSLPHTTGADLLGHHTAGASRTSVGGAQPAQPVGVQGPLTRAKERQTALCDHTSRHDNTNTNRRDHTNRRVPIRPVLRGHDIDTSATVVIHAAAIMAVVSERGYQPVGAGEGGACGWGPGTTLEGSTRAN